MNAQGEAPRTVSVRSRLLLVVVASVVGLAIGFKYAAHGVTFDRAVRLVSLLAATVLSVELLRTAPDKKLWLVPCAMAVALWLVYRLHFLSVPLAMLALAAWVALVAACLLRRRRGAIWCVAICAVTVAISVANAFSS